MLKIPRIVAKKEIRLLFKSTRRILLLFSTSIIILLIAGLGLIIGVATFSAIEQPTEVLIIQDDQGYNNTNWGDFFYDQLKNSELTKDLIYSNKTVSELDTLLVDNKFNILVYIPANFSELINYTLSAEYYIFYDNSELKNEDTILRINEVGSQLNQYLIYIEYGGPININRVYSIPQGTSKGLGAGLASILTLVPLYAIIMLVIPPLTLVLISVTREREQKTLESLILQPIERRDIIAGKLLYGLLLVLFNTFQTIGAIIFVLGGVFLLIPNDVKEVIVDNISEITGNIGSSAWLFIIYLLIGMIVVSILMVTAAVFFSLMAKDEREANMVISTLIVIPIIGSMLLTVVPLIIPDWLQLALFAIPILGYLFSVYTAALVGELTVWIWMSLVFQILWVGLLIKFTGRLIESEGILEISLKKLFSFRKKRY